MKSVERVLALSLSPGMKQEAFTDKEDDNDLFEFWIVFSVSAVHVINDTNCLLRIGKENISGNIKMYLI